MSNNRKVQVLVTIPFSEELVAQIAALSPRLKVTLLSTQSREDISPELWSKVEVLYTDTVLPEPEWVPNLKYIQFHWSGVDFAIDHPILKAPGLQAASLSGAMASQMGEFVLMMMLSLGHRMSDIIHNQSKAEWSRDRWERFTPQELRGSTVGIIGYGSVGRQIARLLQPFGVTILATKKDVKRPQDNGYIPEGQGDADGVFFNRLYPIQALGSMVRLCDFVVVCLPLTGETRGLIGAEVFQNMKPSAMFVSVGRGGVVDRNDLLTALQEKKIAAAALDVFAQEPLPPESPFWHLPNVIVSPHIAGISPHYRERAADLFKENLRRYLDGTPLYNLIDPEKGY
ncbi:MAG: D-2-hydroxyacid dehydrogenase [Anaerolineae bacterium]|nr:D-2-hydroxyacid dehydrogenase [Anaerolineae bacterium]